MNTLRSRSTLTGIALLALAFIAGAGSGVAVERLLLDRVTVTTRVVQDMSGVLDQLALTGDQRRQAEAILDRGAPRTQSAMIELAARLRRVSDSVDMELRSILTPEQRSKLDSLRRRPTFVLKRDDGRGVTRLDTVYPLQKR